MQLQEPGEGTENTPPKKPTYLSTPLINILCINIIKLLDKIVIRYNSKKKSKEVIRS